MRALTEDQLKKYSISQLLRLRERMINYITPYSESEIKWELLDKDGMQEFFDENYYDSKNCEYISWIDDYEEVPIGMHYLLFDLCSDNIKYFIGSIPNNLDKRTIIGCIMFVDNCKLNVNDEESSFVTGIEQVEINYFYQQQGLLTKMLNEFSKVINKEQDVITTMESNLGKLCRMMEHIKTSLINNGFKKDIRFEYEVDEEYIKKLKKK